MMMNPGTGASRAWIAIRVLSLCALLVLVAPNVCAEDDTTEQPAAGGDKLIGGMSIVGNDEAPKSLVIVPWKSSDLGDTLDVSRLMDDSRRPVDREVFSRELDYYEIRTGEKP